MRLQPLVLTMCLAGVLAACSSDGSGSTVAQSTVVQSTVVQSTVVQSTVVQSTVTQSTVVQSTVVQSSPPSSAEPCTSPTSAEAVVVDFPNTLSALVGSDIRTGAHPCFERVVLELQGSGNLPGYRVEYVDDPVKLSPSDLEVEVVGDATLVLSVGAWMTTMDGEGYQGSDDIVPTNVKHIRELRLIENFEGMHQWAIGLDEHRFFEAMTLVDPPRIVIDIAN